MFTKETILEEINKDIQKKYDGDLYKCRLILFQYFKLKNLYNRHRDYVGFILYDGTLSPSEIGTLRNAGILAEEKNIKIDNYYFELLCQFYKPQILKEKIKSILNQHNIPYDENDSIYGMFLKLKNSDENIYKKREYFPFRFFKLSEKYAPYESVLWETLKQEYGWRLPYKLVRGSNE